jgi:hypothetical protein
MRIAHLIITHKSPAQLERLLNALSHPQFECFIQLDKKANLEDFLYLKQNHKVSFVDQRVDVRWGTYSLIQAQLNGIRAVVETNRFDYINVISGQDFPLQSPEAIYQFFCRNQGKEFIACTQYKAEDEWWNEAIPRVWHYNFHNWRIPGKYRLQSLANAVLPKRKYPIANHTIVGRSQWLSITTECARYMLQFLDSHPEVVRYFKYVWGADEFIFSTVVYNSPFQSSIEDNLVYTDWSEKKASPKLFTIKDIDTLKHTDKLFARKFDMEVDSRVLDALEQWIGQQQELA